MCRSKMWVIPASGEEWNPLARSEALALVFLLGKDFQGSKLKVTLTRKKGPMNSMRGGMPPREQRGMPPPLRGGNVRLPRAPEGPRPPAVARFWP